MIRSPLRLLAVPAAIGVLALSLGGCVSLLPKATPAQLYRFGASERTTTLAPAPDARSISMAPLVFPREATNDGILTVEGDGTAYITGARWVAPASILFRQALDHAFMAAAPRIHIQERGEPGRVSAVMDLQVTRFDARYQGPGAPTVEVSVRARLTGDDGAVIAAQDFSTDQVATANRVGEIVAAYDSATKATLVGLAKWVDAHTPDNTAAPAVSTSTPTSTKTTTTTRQP